MAKANPQLCCVLHPHIVCVCKRRFCINCANEIMTDPSAEWKCPICWRTWKEMYSDVTFATVQRIL